MDGIKQLLSLFRHVDAASRDLLQPSLDGGVDASLHLAQVDGREGGGARGRHGSHRQL